MAKIFLRSGNLDSLLILGENGQPVYASALQLRETLRLRKEHKIADCLAIPQSNENGDRLDWYAPCQGQVKSWINASNEEREEALSLLEGCQAQAKKISQQAQTASKPAMRLFGALLNKAFQFPDQQYVYLVDGKPVITFWGFSALDSPSSPGNSLDILRNTLFIAAPSLTEPTSVVKDKAITELQKTEPMVSACQENQTSLPSKSETAPQVPIITRPESTSAARFPRRWMISGAVVAIMAATTVTVTLYNQHSRIPPVTQQQPVHDQPAKPHTQAEPAPHPIPRLIPEDLQATIMALSGTLPVQRAREVTPRVTVAEPLAPVVLTPEQTPPIKTVPEKTVKNALVMPADAVKLGSTKFLNGNWRVKIQMPDLPANKRLNLKYQFNNGQGTVSLTHDDNIRCRTSVAAGLMSSGNLVINSRYAARCSDGSRYKMPQLVCKQGNAATECLAQYGTDTSYPMTITRESK